MLDEVKRIRCRIKSASGQQDTRIEKICRVFVIARVSWPAMVKVEARGLSCASARALGPRVPLLGRM